MANIFSSSIGKKLVMSLSGLFLMLFLLMHLSINFAAVASEEAYNAACHFMDTNIFIQIMVPVLAFGFFIHIVYAAVLTLHNRSARPAKYAVSHKGRAASWASRNMFVLGLIVIGFAAVHLSHFWAEMQLQHFIGSTATDNPYLLVKTTLENPLWAAVYIVWFWVLWFHLTHGFWSALHTIGLNTQKWLPRLRIAATVFATLVAAGYSFIALWFALGFAK